MNNFIFYTAVVVMFNYYILKVFAINDFYMITIRRNSNDKEYYKASKTLQNKIDVLVNDRMNDIYNIIDDNRETYTNEDGEFDEILEELTVTSKLRKRDDKEYKIQFINEIQSKKINKKTSKKLKNRLMESKHVTKESIEYISYQSSLVKHICAVKNYYIIVAYLSDIIVDKIRLLPNVIDIEKSRKVAVPLNTINRNLIDRISYKYYNIE